MGVEPTPTNPPIETMPHDHAAHDASLARDPKLKNRFRIAIALNIVIVIAELVYGILDHSVALLADAGHNVADVLALVFAMTANILASRPPTARRTYGYRRTTILAALLNAMVILILTGGILFGAVHRLQEPAEVNGLTVSMVAGLAIVLNSICALLLLSHKHDLNVRAPFLHLIGDAASAAGVLIAGLLIEWTGKSWIDPIASILIAVTILLATWKILRESFNLAADAVPEHLDPTAIEEYLRSVEGVTEVHDLHIWGMSTTHVVLTSHLVIPNYAVEDSLLFQISHELKSRFGIDHATLQIERGMMNCELASSHVI
jgi:cobalt-zinc-cadmium efflux system protein